MPAFDGTGPMGRGAMTGRGRGCCAGNGRGMGRGFGFGRGFCGFFPFTRPRITAADERAMLDEEVQAASQYLEDLRARRKELGDK
ncbi:MAG: DUF5320 domain-containing protein [Candidatus Peribacteraceae bacterium]|nr:DUF5320 domain-containing protein [Candidatus Peribacteraceae bacterium]